MSSPQIRVPHNARFPAPSRILFPARLSWRQLSITETKRVNDSSWKGLNPPLGEPPLFHQRLQARTRLGRDGRGAVTRTFSVIFRFIPRDAEKSLEAGVRIHFPGPSSWKINGRLDRSPLATRSRDGERGRTRGGEQISALSAPLFFSSLLPPRSFPLETNYQRIKYNLARLPYS